MENESKIFNITTINRFIKLSEEDKKCIGIYRGKIEEAAIKQLEEIRKIMWGKE